MTKGIIYYTDNEVVFPQVLASIILSGLPVVSCSLKPINFGKNIVLDLKRGKETYLKQIITALENSDADYVFMCEHDVIYNPSHFDFEPKEDKFYFNTNVWKWKYGTDLIVWTDDLQQVSGLSGYRKTLLEYYRNKQADGHYEPKENTENYMSAHPNIDIRHDKNLTKSKWSPADFRNKKYAKGWREYSLKKLHEEEFGDAH